MTALHELHRGQFLLAKKIWPSISEDKTAVIFTKCETVIFPLMTDQWVFREGRGWLPLFGDIRVKTEAHSGGFMGYNAEYDRLVIRELT